MHELTEKIWKLCISGCNPGSTYWSQSGVDSIIRTYLEEKAKELKRISNGCKTPGHLSVEDKIYLTLGLSPSKEMSKWRSDCAEDPCHNISSRYDSKPKDSEVWCEHVVEEGGLLFVVHVGQKVGFPFWYNNCPICGEKRPQTKPKSLVDKFREKLSTFREDVHCGTYFATPEELAGIAEQHFKEKL